MTTFPTLKSLAESDEKKVLKLWEGLGYYSRARNIHGSAREIMKKHGGNFPADFESILLLKGIGRYTAGAIASIAFNQDRPIVDGNVLRVLSRVYAIRKPIDVEKNKAFFWEQQEKLIPKGKARYFNQALMELGALVCTSQNPSCALCPIRSFCKAEKAGNPEDYPFRKFKKKTVKVNAAALVMENDGKYLLRLRPVGKIMGGLWEFPEWKLSYGRGPVNAFRLPAGQAGTASGKVNRLAEKEFGVKLKMVHIGKIRRSYTHHLETLHVFKSNTAEKVADKSGWKSLWASKKEFAKHPFSSAHAKIAALLD
jgi:A/G-specific adenine glycosylase